MITTGETVRHLDIAAAGRLLDNFAAAVEDEDESTAGRLRFELLDLLTAGAAGRTMNPAGTVWPAHGVGSLGHGATPECDVLGGDDCNNGQCRQKLNHDRCTPECTALVVWDRRTGGSWQPGAANLAGAESGDLVVMADLIAQGGPR